MSGNPELKQLEDLVQHESWWTGKFRSTAAVANGKSQKNAQKNFGIS
jgi:hypothetical protein